MSNNNSSKLNGWWVVVCALALVGIAVFGSQGTFDPVTRFAGCSTSLLVLAWGGYRIWKASEELLK